MTKPLPRQQDGAALLLSMVSVGAGGRSTVSAAGSIGIPLQNAVGVGRVRA